MRHQENKLFFRFKSYNGAKLKNVSFFEKFTHQSIDIFRKYDIIIFENNTFAKIFFRNVMFLGEKQGYME